MPSAIFSSVFIGALQLLDPFSVGSGITGEAGTVGKNLVGDLIGEGIQIALCLLGQKHLAGHAVRAFFLLRMAL